MYLNSTKSVLGNNRHRYILSDMLNVSSTTQLYEHHSKVTHNGEEKARFSALTLDYMSEEASSDGGETMFIHQPPWHSNSRC